LRRDADGDGLVEMMTESHSAAKGSDWIDVIWAAHENAFVNAQLYQALTLWSAVEDILGADGRAADYRRQAARLKTRFNATTADGGFWNAGKQWYVHWRDRDDSIHGDNLVLPVNFMAIAYGLCEPPERSRTVLDQVQMRMELEGLFFWPLCFESYQPGEGAAGQFPFPTYENGDLFLAWGETAIRAYAAYRPGVAVQVIRNVLDQYERDGLACQRYSRKTQRGEGSDILANNCSPIVGLYRNLYGIQPKWNRLYLEPHLIPELNGTQLKYWLRGQSYTIDLRLDDYRVAVDEVAVASRDPFAVNITPGQVDYFLASGSTPALTLTRPETGAMEIRIETWPGEPQVGRAWTVTVERPTPLTQQTVSGLAPAARYRLLCDGLEASTLTSDTRGHLLVPPQSDAVRSRRFELRPER
jgi:hypothetical protein